MKIPIIYEKIEVPDINKNAIKILSSSANGRKSPNPIVPNVVKE
jgi:hypothetical protein